MNLKLTNRKTIFSFSTAILFALIVSSAANAATNVAYSKSRIAGVSVNVVTIALNAC